MRILFLHQYFKTPESGGAIRSSYLVKAFIKAGFQVSLITAHNLPKKKTSIYHGAEIIYLPVEYGNDFNFIKRIRAFIKFYLMAFKEAQKLDFDWVYAISTPLTIGLLATRLKKPFIFEVGDLWPDVPIEMRILKNPILIHIAKWIELNTYRKARLIVSMSTDIYNRIKSKSPKTDNIVIPNFSDNEIFKAPDKIKTLQSQEKVICAYTGTAGIANDIQQILYLAKEADSKYHFIIQGNGREWEKYSKGKYENVEFREFSNKDDMAALLEISTFNIICYADYQILGTGSPNKYFDGLAASCISIINVNGWIRNEIEENECGIFWDVHQHKKTIEKMDQILIDKDKCLRAFQNSKRLAQDKYDYKVLTDNLVSKFKEITKKDYNPIP